MTGEEKDKVKGDKKDDKKENKKDNKIVMINSFKGGAGKTTAALCRCMSEYKGDTYQNIYYVDLDILGTGVEYVLSLEKQKVYYNDLDDRKNSTLQEKVQKINLEGKNHFFAAILNPVSRRKESYSGQDRLRSCPDVERGIFQSKVKKLLNQILNRKGKNLIVLDCAPGISYTEECILADIYAMRDNDKKSVEVEEIYVTTPDASHIRKTAESLNEYAAYLKKKNRTVTILINDLFDCEGMSQREREEGEEAYFLFKKQNVIREIESIFHIPSLKIFYLPYNENLLKKSIIKNEAKLINRPDDYDVWPTKAEVEKEDVGEEEAERVEAQKEEIEKAEKGELQEEEAGKAEGEKAEAGKVEAQEEEIEKAEAEKVEAEQAKAGKTEAKQAEAEKVETQKAEIEKVEEEQEKVEKVEAEKAEAGQEKMENAKKEKEIKKDEH
ncbi:MAG: hypothetical protein HFI03_05585 [Lachnospiraceae bacterium]|jgi:cellulose biosynthesis protein BcsQ|nr:hypothetical protein [Lachnospiraceae bacterium]